jgi:O-antigen/teichoic acid export membrane protein
MPRLAALRESRGIGAVKHRLWQLQMLLMLPFVFLLTGMVFWGDPVMCGVFGHAQGNGLGWAAVVFGVVVGLRVLFDLGAGMMLRIMGETKAFFINGWVIGVFGGGFVGVAALFGGLIPVLLAKALVSLMGGGVLVVYARKVVRNHYTHD